MGPLGAFLAIMVPLVLLVLIAIIMLRHIKGALSVTRKDVATEGGGIMPPRNVEEAFGRWLLAQAEKQTGVKLSNNDMALQRLEEAAKKALKELQTTDKTTINLPFIASDASGPKNFTIDVSLDDIPNAP